MFGGPRIPSVEAVQTQCSLFKSFGHDTIDTSRAYPLEHLGRSEELLASSGTARWATIDTKINSLIDKALSKGNVKASIEQSLRALAVDQVDIMYLTMPSLDVPFEETVEAMDAAWREGKFRRFGLSNYSPGEVEEIVEFAETKGMLVDMVRLFGLVWIANGFEQVSSSRLSIRASIILSRDWPRRSFCRC